jgi:integrase
VAAYRLPVVVTLFNAAVDAELIERNPFGGLSCRTRGRSDEHPPTKEQMDRLVARLLRIGLYAPQMRALLIFAAYSGMRPGELFALEWPDIDFDAMRIHVSRRLYKGRVDLPKSNKPRTIALTPPGRDAILGQRTRQDGQLVFRSKRGMRLLSRRCRATGRRCSPAPGSTSTSTWPPSTTRSTTFTPNSACRRG